MTNKVEGTGTILWTLNEEQIAQPNVVDRIHKAVIYIDGNVEFLTAKGTTLSSLSLPINKTDAELKTYFSQVFWVAYQALGLDSYRLVPNVRGYGAGGNVSTGKPGTSPLSGEILKVYRHYKKNDPTWTLDKMLLTLVESLMKWHRPAIVVRESSEKLSFDLTWIEGLLKAGADPNITDKHHRSLIELLCYYAVTESKESRDFSIVADTAKALIQGGAKVSRNLERRPLIEPACLNTKAWSIYRVLLPEVIKNGWAIHYNDPDEEGCTLLDKVISKAKQNPEFLKCAQDLIDAGLDVKQGRPLHAVASLMYSSSFSSFSTSLLSKGPSLEVKDSKGKSLLEASVSHPELFKKLLDAGASLEDSAVNIAAYKAAISAGTEGQIHPYLKGKVAPAKALHFAVEQQKYEFVRKIVKEQGVSIDYVDADNPLTCLQILFKAHRWNQEDENRLKLLLELGADVKKIEEVSLIAAPSRIKQQFPAAVQYAFRAGLSHLREVLAVGNNADYVDTTYPETCLQTLCRENKWEGDGLPMLRLLLDYRADTQRIRAGVFNALPVHVKKLMPELYDLKEIAQPFIQKVMLGLNSEHYRSLESAGKMQATGNIVIQELEKLPQIQRLLLDDSDTGVTAKKKLVETLVVTLNSTLSKTSDLTALSFALREALREWQAQVNLQIQAQLEERIQRETADQQRADLQRLAANEKEMQAKIAEMQRQLAVSEESIRAYSRQAAQTEAERKNLEETVAKQKQALSGAVYLSSQTQREMLYYGIRLN